MNSASAPAISSKSTSPSYFYRQSPGLWYGGVGDTTLGVKRVLFANLDAGSILSAFGGIILPSGNRTTASAAASRHSRLSPHSRNSCLPRLRPTPGRNRTAHGHVESAPFGFLASSPGQEFSAIRWGWPHVDSHVRNLSPPMLHPHRENRLGHRPAIPGDAQPATAHPRQSRCSRFPSRTQPIVPSKPSSMSCGTGLTAAYGRVGNDASTNHPDRRR